MSVCSTASQSVSVFGTDDVDLEVATDKIFKELQDTLNQTHCAIRELVMIPERNETYIEAAAIYHDIKDYTIEFADLMKELGKVANQIIGPCPSIMKAEYKEFLTRRSIENAEQKQEKDILRSAILSNK